MSQFLLKRTLFTEGGSGSPTPILQKFSHTVELFWWFEVDIFNVQILLEDEVGVVYVDLLEVALLPEGEDEFVIGLVVPDLVFYSLFRPFPVLEEPIQHIPVNLKVPTQAVESEVFKLSQTLQRVPVEDDTQVPLFVCVSEIPQALS